MKKDFYFSVLFLIVMTIFMVSCSEDDGSGVSESQKQITSIVSQLEKMDGINSSFIEGLKKLDFSKMDEKAFTVFAISDSPLKSSASLGSTSSDMVIERQIVKGAYTLSQLKNGFILYTLSGDQLAVIVSDGVTYINGVEISGSVTQVSNSCIFKVNQLFPREMVEVKKVQFVVERCNEGWSPLNMQPYMLVPEAEINIYTEEGNLFGTYIADRYGIVKVSLPVGVYSYEVNKGNERNIFSKQEEAGYVIAGIFTSQDEIDQMPYQLDVKLGGLKYVDYNGDGIIDNNDKTDRVYFHVESDFSNTVYIASLNFASTYLPTVSITELIFESQDIFKKILRINYGIDAVLTHQATINQTDFVKLSNFNIHPDNSIVRQLWDYGYSFIIRANKVINHENLSEEQLMGALFYRAYAYSILVDYFGGVPIISNVTMGNEPRSSVDDVCNYIYAELDMIIAKGNNSLKYSALQLKARIAAGKGEFERAKMSLQEIINSGLYSLPSNISTWGGDKISEGIDLRFSGTDDVLRKGEFSYLIRYTETLLLYAEVTANLGEITVANQTVNMLLAQQNLAPVNSSSRDQVHDIIYELRTTLLNKEGIEYVALKRMNKFLEVLQNFGAQEFHQLLPIPISVMSSNPNMVQNSGY